MPLAKQNIAIPFGQGINTKLDPKQLTAGPLTNLQNGIFTKQGEINKRFGLDQLSRSIDLTGDIILQGEALSTYNNQLLLFTGSKAYSRLGFNQKWSDKGQVSSVINSTFQVIRNDYDQANPDVAKIDNLECYVWEDDRGGVRFSVVDSETGNFIVNDKLISLEGSKPKATAVYDSDSAKFIIFFVNGTTLQYTRIDTDNLTGAVIVYTLTSDLHENQVYDACSSISSVDGVEQSAAFVTYAGRYDSTYVYTNPRTYKLDVDAAYLWSYDSDVGATAPALITCSPMPDASFGQAAQTGSTSIIMWHDDSDLKIAKIPYYIGTLTSIDITVPASFHLYELEQMALNWNGHVFTDQANVDVFFQFDLDGYKYVQSGTLQVFMHGEVYAVSDLTNLNMRKHITLYSKPFVYNENNYIVVSYDSTYQSTYFLMNKDLQVVSKANQNLGGGARTAQLSEVIMNGYDLTEFLSADGYDVGVPVSTGIFKVPTLKTGRLQSENELFSKLGITSTAMDFASKNHFLSTELNSSLHVVGGILQTYDGNKFYENNFHLYPEDLTSSSTNMAVAVTRSGTGVVEQIIDGYMVAGSRIRPGDYWTLYSGLDARSYYVWYKVDGVGTDPAITDYGMEVRINSYYTPTQVATATKSVINLFYYDFTATSSGSQVTVTNTIVGATSSPSSGTMTVGSMAAGTYQYVAVWKWQDNQGFVHRSTPSIAKTHVITGSNRTCTIGVPILSLTKKSNIVLEVYRTDNLGQIFYKVSSVDSPTFNINNNDGYYMYNFFTDSTADADIIDNEILYTTGGVLDNNPPPPCSLIASYQNRLFIAGLDNKNLIQYSKITPPDQKDYPVGFSDTFTIELDQAGGDITALVPLDDKLIIFKEKQIYYINGNGPNNLGQGATYIEPQLITTDVGCNNANSVVTMPNGLMFKSDKGIYILDRSLQVNYLGAAVEDFNDLTISSSILLNDVNQVRFITEDGVALVYDYYFNQWSTFTNYEGVDCDIFGGKLVLLRSNGYVQRENTSSFLDENDGENLHVPLVLETGDLSFAGLNGFQRVYRAHIVGEYKGRHNTVVSFAYDYSPVYIDSATFDGYSVIGQYAYGTTGPYGETNGDVYGGVYVPYQFRVHLKQQKCTAIRVKIEDTQNEPYNEGFNISGLTLQVGIKPSGYKLPANKSLGSD